MARVVCGTTAASAARSTCASSLRGTQDAEPRRAGAGSAALRNTRTLFRLAARCRAAAALLGARDLWFPRARLSQVRADGVLHSIALHYMTLNCRYERMLLNAARGDQTLSVSAAELVEVEMTCRIRICGLFTTRK